MRLAIDKIADFIGFSRYERNHREIYIWLKILSKILKKVKKEKGINLKLKDINIDDKKTYQLISKGDVKKIYGINYKDTFSQKFFQEFKPSNFIEFRDTLFMYRPDPLAVGICDLYIENKQVKKELKYYDKNLDKKLKPILDPSYGAILYHQQVVEIFETIGGFSFPKADMARYAINKKYKKQIKSYKVDFLNNCIKKGYNRSNCKKLFDFIVNSIPFAYYNQQLATNAAKLAFYLAYLKTHFKKEFDKITLK